MHCWFPYSFAHGRIRHLVEAAILSWKREASGELGAFRLYVVRFIFWTVPTADWPSLSSAVAYMCPSFQVDHEVVDRPSMFCEAFPTFTTCTWTPRANGIFRIFHSPVKSMYAQACRRTLPWLETNVASNTLESQWRMLVSSSWRYANWLLLMSNGNDLQVWNGWAVSYGRSRHRCSRASSSSFVGFWGVRVGPVWSWRARRVSGDC